MKAKCWTSAVTPCREFWPSESGKTPTEHLTHKTEKLESLCSGRTRFSSKGHVLRLKSKIYIDVA